MLRKLIFWSCCYVCLSIALFAALWLSWPGFPFFPKTVYSSKSEDGVLTLKKGTYYVLYFIEGRKKLPIRRGEVGQISIFAISPVQQMAQVALSPSNFYFDDAPDGDGIRGHSVACFSIPKDVELHVKAAFLKYGYNGFMIRTGFAPMLVSVGCYELGTILLSILAAWLLLRLFQPKSKKE